MSIVYLFRAMKKFLEGEATSFLVKSLISKNIPIVSILMVGLYMPYFFAYFIIFNSSRFSSFFNPEIIPISIFILMLLTAISYRKISFKINKQRA